MSILVKADTTNLENTVLPGLLTKLRSAGVSAGQEWGSGFMGVVETSVGVPLIDMLVRLVTPNVMARIVFENGRTGSAP